MTETDYRRALDAACREYEAVVAQRSSLDQRLAELTRTIATLSRLCGLVPTAPLGLTDACRLVLRHADHPLTAGEVRTELEAIGFDLSKYVNPLASIHVTLRRLTLGGEAHLNMRETPGRPLYGWRQLPPGAFWPWIPTTHASTSKAKKRKKP